MLEGPPIRDVEPIQLLRVKAHLIVEVELSLVDAGYAGSSSRIVRAIEARGRAVGELRRVICTHGHPDHAGGARELASDDVTILIHPADAANLATTWREVVRKPTRGRVFAAMTPTPPRTTPIEDGEIIGALGGLRVVHTPGHTPGSVCLYGARDRVLFVGDTLQRRFGRLTFASALYSDDVRMARRSVKRLAALDVETIVFSHYPPLTAGANETLARLASQLD